jgi:Domain of unknown function (DUF397)
MSDTWRKPSYSGSQANCVQVGNTPGLIKIRDTKDSHGPTLTVNADAWRQFTTAIQGRN